MAKPRKVEESASPYVAAKPVATGSEAAKARTAIRYADLKVVRKTNIKLMQVHRKVLQKLAQ